MRYPRRAQVPWIAEGCPMQAGFSRLPVTTLAGRLRDSWSQRLFPAGPEEQPPGGWFWAGLAFLAVLAGALLLTGLSYPLYEPDEGRYAEIGREMLASGNWVVLMLNNTPHHDKPPMFGWLVAGIFGLFGVQEWAARLVPAGAALLTVLLLYVVGARSVGTRAAFLAALALTLTVGFVVAARILTIDSVLTLFVTASLMTALEAVRGQRLRWGWWLASAACCGLGLLTKGPVALVLLGPPVAAHAWLQRLPGRPAWRHWAAYLGLAGAVALPWYVTAAVTAPDFAREFIVKHHLQRFFSGTEHPGPFWYYAPVLVVGGLPWSLLAWPLARFLWSRSPEVRALRSRPMGFFLLWAGWCVLFFSLSRGKLPLYVLPAAPALALLTGCYLRHALARAGAVGAALLARPAAPQLFLLGVATVWLVGGLYAVRRQYVGPVSLVPEAAAFLGCVVGLALGGRRLSVRAGWLLGGLLLTAMLWDLSHDLVPGCAAQRKEL